MSIYLKRHSGTPTRSIELKQVELPVDEDVNPEDVEDNFVPQKRLSQEDMKELMSSESIPDPDFSGACTFEELGNVADVLLNRTTDKKKIMDAAETLYKLQDSDIYHFYTTSISTEKQVDRLLRDNLDGAGRRLNGKHCLYIWLTGLALRCESGCQCLYVYSATPINK